MNVHRKEWAMNKKTLEHTIRRAGASLADSLLEYWPSVGKNEMCEKNAVLHLGHALLKEGFYVYGECHSNGNTDERLDLLALNLKESAQVMVEAKRLYSVEKVGDVIQDVDRLAAFRLTGKDLNNALKDRFCVLIATTWDEKYVQWWSSMDGEQPSEHENWSVLNTHRALNDALWGSMVLQGYSTEQKCTDKFQYLLYCVFRQPKTE